MDIESAQSFLLSAMEIMTALFIILAGLTVLIVIVVFVLDVTQTKQAIRRNYPVVGHFR